MDKWINNNNIAKVIALCMSILLWAMVHLDNSGTVVPVTSSVSTKTIDDVKIQVSNFDEDKYVLYSLEPDTVRLEVRGKRSSITSVFSDDNYKVKLDLNNIGPGTHSLPLTADLPSGVDVVSISPAYVQVTIEAKASKDFDASVVTTGEPKEGLQIGTPILADSSKVKVTLPESEIQEVDKVQGTIDVTGIDSSIKGKSVKLVAYNKAGEVIKDAEISPDTIEVEVPVIQLYKSVPVEIHTRGTPPSGEALSKVESNVDQVVIYGPRDKLDQINSFPVTVDLDQIKGEKESVIKVNLAPPEGFDKIEPDSLEITVKAAPYLTKTIEGIPIDLINIGNGYTATVTSPADGEMNLPIKGTEDRMTSITVGDLSLTANLKGLGPGRHKVTLDLNMPRYVFRTSDEPITIEVEIVGKDKPAATTPDTDHSPDSSGGGNSQNDPGSSNNSGTGNNTNTGDNGDQGTGSGQP